MLRCLSTAANSLNYDARSHQFAFLPRDQPLSPPFVASAPRFVISKQPASLGHFLLTSHAPLPDNNGAEVGLGASARDPRAIAIQGYEALEQAPIAIEASAGGEVGGQVTGIVLTADDLMMSSKPGEDDLPPGSFVIKEEPMDPRLNTILQSKVKIQPRPFCEEVTAPVASVPAAKRPRNSSTVKTVVPTMMTGEDTGNF